MKRKGTGRIEVWPKNALILAALFSLFISANCAEIKLGTIPTPPPGAKLRIFVKAVSGEIKRGGWKITHDDFENLTYRNIRSAIADGTTYVVVPEEEVRIVIGKREPMSWQWEKNNWALTVEVGKKLHAEYAMIVERSFDTSLKFRFALINVDTKKVFENIAVTSAPLNTKERSRTYRNALMKLNTEATDDLLATANRKGRNASKELAETKKEIQELIDTQEGQSKSAITTAKVKKPDSPATPSTIEASRQDRVAQLEARLANLMETLAQVEVMKKQLENQRIKSDLLAEELAERDQREKVLLSKLEDSSKDPPVVVVASPEDNSKVEFNFVYLSGVAEDETGVKELEIFANGKLLIKSAGRGLRVTRAKDPTRLEFKERIPLVRGVNTVKIRAVDSDGLFSERTLTVHYVEKNKNIWAVVIGIDTYPKIRELKYAVNDARTFYDHLVKHNDIPSENVILLLNQDATLIKIRSTLGTILKNKAGKDDMVIIFYAGHGATERDAYSPDGDGLEKYLLPFDADLKDLYATALPMGELSRIFSRIRSERLIFIADACYSGASGGRSISMTGMRASISEAFINRIAGGKGRVIITASKANEVSAEKDELQHGVFTYFLLEGLRGKADINKDGLVTVDEAYNYVSEHVPQATAQEQHPVKIGIVEGQLILSIVN